MFRRLIAAMVGAAISTACAAQELKPIRLGVLNDQSGVYADFGGRGSSVAARMAVEDYGGRVLGRPVEVLSADHQNKRISPPRLRGAGSSGTTSMRCWI